MATPATLKLVRAEPSPANEVAVTDPEYDTPAPIPLGSSHGFTLIVVVAIPTEY